VSLFEAFRFDGKRTLVVGGATGMGAATVEVLLDAGADVVVMDYADVMQSGVTAIKLNLSEKDSIDAALDALGGTVDALFSCAGVADGTPGIERVNFIGHRYMIDGMLERGMLPRGSSIGMISSAAGLGWESNLEVLQELLAIKDWDASVQWVVDHGWADYFHMKQAVCAYVAYEAFALIKQGIRINAICPGPTDTPLARANAEQWFGLATDYREDTGTEVSTPLEQAYPLVFVASAAAAAITGQTIVSDVGYLTSGLAGSYPNATPSAQFLYGRLT
jgi:NAD(P)-dependent dehydrogenase (short-subunit alcohol dehydrogenase family)